MTKHLSPLDCKLASLQKLEIIDTPRQAAFDNVTRLLSLLLGAPICLVSLLDNDRQWFLSRQGVDIDQTPRDIAICSAVVDSGLPLLVSDLSSDERFRHNPLVVGEPFIRSYLGHPIKSPDGELIGTLCVADTQSRAFDQGAMEIVQSLSLIVEDLLVSHRRLVDLRRLNADFQAKNFELEKATVIFDQAESAARMGSWAVDVQTNKLTWSKGVYAIHGVPHDEQVSIDDAIAFYSKDDREKVEQFVNRAISHKSPFEFEAELHGRDGKTRRVSSRGEYLNAGNGHGPRIVGVFRDITESHKDKLALRRAADYDNLTGLYNRRAFDRALAQRIEEARAQDLDVSVLLADLDGFKGINDRLGHLVGDTVLTKVADMLRRDLPEATVCARWGGDEFAFIAPLGMSEREVSDLAQQIIQTVGQGFDLAGERLRVGLTCGIANSNGQLRGKEIVRRADLALLQGKRRDPGSAIVYSSALENLNSAKRKAISTLTKALDQKRVFAGYQPIVDLQSGVTAGLEALLRISTETDDVLMASDILAAILDPSMAKAIGAEMMNLICDDAPKIETALPDVSYLSINATEAELLSADFATRFLRHFDMCGRDPSRIVLEVTETMLMVNDPAAVRSVLEKLSDAGVRIALDDFGTGFSSLSHLRDFPIDIVKIDKSFISAIPDSEESLLIVEALVGMAKNLGLTTIAEGVETGEQRAILAGLGCDYGQGFLFSPALPIPQIVSWQRNRNGSADDAEFE